MKKEKKAFASKQTLNLVVRERSLSRPSVFIPLLLLILAVAGLLGFGVSNRLGAVSAAKRELDDLVAQTEAIKAIYANYDELEEEYSRYTYTGMDQTLVDCREVFDLLEREIMPVCAIQRFDLLSRQLNLSLGGMTLDGARDLVERLKADDLVAQAYMVDYDASKEGGEATSVANVTVILVDATQQDGQTDKEVAR